MVDDALQELPRVTEPEKPALAEVQQALDNFPQYKSIVVPELNYSQAKKALMRLIGPKARIWRRNNRIEMGAGNEKERAVLGIGPTYSEALKMSATTLANMMYTNNQNKKEKAVEEVGAVKG